MKILLLQTDIKWQQPDENRIHVKELIKNNPQADLIILPEMFTTGFCISPKEIAEGADTETLRWMQSVSKETNAAITGSVAVIQNGKYYNRLYFVKPDGSHSIYDKHHLFTFAGEHKEYEPGEERVIVEYSGFRILLQICYDLRFPVFSRNKGDYDMIIYVANWPAKRLFAWDILLRARAIENACYVAAVNRTGDDPACQYSGGTALINYLGQTIVSAQSGKEDVAYGEIEKEGLNAFRKSFPALQDIDQFTINYVNEKEITDFG